MYNRLVYLLLICFNKITTSKKGGVLTLYERIKSEYKRLDEQINSVKSKLSQLPPGKLICCTHNNHTKWYQSDGHNKSYLSKKNQELAGQLTYKKYLFHLLKDLENEKMAFDFYLRHHSTCSNVEKFLTTPSEYQKLLTPYLEPLSQELSDWMHAPFETNTHHSENLIYKTSSGNTVRSKSEMMIDMSLHTHRIPFRYECALHLNTTTIYPDFTIRHPETGQFYYWEHFGLMDKPSYAENSSAKINIYTSHGIIPGIHLITTYETQEYPLSSEVIEKLIDHFFL